MLLLCHILAYILTKMGRRRVIYDHLNPDGPYLLRHYICGAGLWFGGDRQYWPIPIGVEHKKPKAHHRLMIGLHRILVSDGDGLHSHPSDAFSLVITGGYFEITLLGRTWRKPWSWRFLSCDSFHRLEIGGKIPVYTIFIMFNRRQDWYFIPKEVEVIPHAIHLGHELP